MNQHTRLLQRVPPPPAQQSGLMQGRARVSAREAGLALGSHQLGAGHRALHSVRRQRAGALETASSAGPALGRGRAEVWGIYAGPGEADRGLESRGEGAADVASGLGYSGDRSRGPTSLACGLSLGFVMFFHEFWPWRRWLPSHQSLQGWTFSGYSGRFTPSGGQLASANTCPKPQPL